MRWLKELKEDIDLACDIRLSQLEFDRLIAIAEGSECVSSGQLDHCLDIRGRRGNTKRLGDILVSKGFLTNEQLISVLHLQAREAFFEALTWDKGTFYFYANVPPSDDEILIHERIDHLLLEGFVRLDNNISE